MLTQSFTIVPGTLSCDCHELADGVVRIAVRGELSEGSAPELEGLVERALGDAAFVVIDLDALSFVDPGGAIALGAAARAGGHRLIAVNAQPQVRATLSVHRALRLAPES